MEYKRNLRVGVEDYTDDELSLDVYGNVNVSGNISVAGTVTYDDVTNVDSIGIVTARTGINVLANGINVSGVSTFTGAADFNSDVDIDGDTQLDDLTVAGVATFSSAINATDIIKGYEYTAAPSGSTVTLAVTVASKDATHRYNGTGSGNGYVIDGIQAPFLTLTPGRTYRFTNDNTGSHPLKFYLEADKTTEYTSGVSFQDTYTEIAVSDETPIVLHYQCTAHSYMGNAIQVNSNVVNTNYAATLRGGLDVTGHTETDTLNVSGVTTVNSLQVETFSTFNGNTKHFDGKYANFGNSTDLQIVHDGSNSVIQNATGQFFIDNNASGGDLFLRANDNVVIRVDGNDTVLTAQTGGIDVTGHTETDNLNVSGVSTFTGNVFFQSNVHLGDNDQLRLGDSNEFKVIHRTAGDSTITSSGAVYVGSAAKVNIASGYNTNFMARFTPGGSSELYHNYNKVFETTASGIDVTGHTETDTLNVSGISTLGTLKVNNDVNVVGVLTAERLYSNVYGEFTGGGISGTNITGTSLNISGISTLGTLQVSNDVNVVGVLTAERLYSNVFGEFTGGGISGTNIVGTSLSISGVSTFQSHVHLGDDDELRFGASNDFKIVHDPNDCRFENSNGDIKFKNTGSYFFFDEDGGETLASFINDGAVNLFHSGNKKFETTSAGINVTGHTELDNLNVSGISTLGTLQVSNDVNVVGVLTAERLYSNVFGEFTGGGISGTNITRNIIINISGISTLGTLQISSGIVTATSGIITYYGDGSGLTNTNFNGASKSVVKYIATDGSNNLCSNL